MRVLFIGTGEIGLPTLRALQNSNEHELIGVVTQPDKPVGRDQTVTPPPIKAAVTRNGGFPAAELPTAAGKPPLLAILQPGRIKDRPSIDEIRALAPDVIVVMAYGQILPRDVLEIPKVACLNLHASLLPRWRGAAPIQAAIAAGNCETGITVMYMNEGLDTGDILLQRKIDIAPGETGGSLHDRLGKIAPEALLESLRLLASGQAPRIRQDNALATNAPKLNREHGRIDWTEPAEVIERKIRAFNPWPGAATTIAVSSGRPLNLKIFSASIVDLKGKPGEVIQANNDGIVFAAGLRAIAPSEVQLEGKQRMNAREFARGHRRIIRSVQGR